MTDTEIDTWSIVDTYFRDSPYYKSQHQLDSYDEFIYSPTNGIQHILQRGNPLQIYKDSLNSEGTEFKYEINIYLGVVLSESGEITESNSIQVSAPTEYTEETPKFMFPNIARLKGYTYQSNVFCNIGVIYKNNETTDKLSQIQEKLESYYIPCKAKYSKDLTEKKCITLLRQFIKVHGYTLISKERYINRKKVYVYRLIKEDEKEVKPKKPKSKNIVISFE